MKATTTNLKCILTEKKSKVRMTLKINLKEILFVDPDLLSLHEKKNY